MSKKLVSLFLVLLMAFSATASLAEGSGITVTDMHGREITLAEPATRIVVMQPSDCEILCAIGCEDTIVGRGQRPSWRFRWFSPVLKRTSRRSWPFSPRSY